MDDFGKFQPHQTADDKVVIICGLWFRNFFKSFFGPFYNAFVVNLLCLVHKK